MRNVVGALVAQRGGVDTVDIQRLVARRVASHEGHARGRHACLLGDEAAQRLVGLAVHRRGGHAYEDGASALADLGREFGAGLTEAELRFLARNEWARTGEDVLWRRSKLGLHLTEAQRLAVGEAMAETIAA